MKSGELKWMINIEDKYSSVSQFKNGLEAATFTDNDFLIPGCNP